MITRKILNWTEKKSNELDCVNKPISSGAKAFGIGFLEGTIDGLVIFGGVWYVYEIGKGFIKIIKK